MKEEKNFQKVFLVIGIAIIIFLILLLGSLIGLKITRDKVNDVVDNINQADNAGQKNYELQEDGTKVVVNENILNFEKEIEGRKFYSVAVKEAEGISTISMIAENVTSEKLDGASFFVKFFDKNGDILESYSVVVASLEAEESVRLVSNVLSDCAEADHMEIEILK